MVLFARRVRQLFMAVQENDHGGPEFVTFEEIEGVYETQILPAIERHIKKGSKIVSDGEGSYEKIKEQGYDHDRYIESQDPEIAHEKLKLDVNTVGRWRNRFQEKRFAGIEKDLPRGANHGGKNTEEQTQLRSKIIEMTTQSKPKNATHWSTRSLAEALEINQSFVGRVWREFGLKPHLTQQFKMSNDPHFEEKLKDVVGLYLSPPENAVVFCVDEKSSIQALDRTQPGLPLKKGRCGTMTHDYKRHGTSTLFAALNTQTGEVMGKCCLQHIHKEFLSFLKTVEKQTAKELDLHLIVDNYATHKHEEVKNWLKRNKRVHLHFIPTSSSWLNWVERFFGLLTEKQLRRGIFTSVKELEKTIMEFINSHNEKKKPFVWTKSAEEILVKVERARQTLSSQQSI